MTLPLRTAEIRRLAFVKYVLSVAHEQSRQSEPNCSLALLQFHDGLELLLQLAAERLNVRVERNTAFLGYWPLLGPALGRDLPHHGAMKRLNEARVGLKHHGHLLARLDVSELGEVTDTFVREIVPLVFGLPWDQVSRLTSSIPKGRATWSAQPRTHSHVGTLTVAESSVARHTRP